MPNHSGPNTNESGLVFSFDVNDYNSFKGQPGTNLGSGPNFGYSSSGLSEFENGKLIRWKSYTEKAHIPTLGVKDVKTIEWYNVYSGYGTDGNYNCCPTIFTYSPNGWNSTILEPSTEYMYQIIYKSASGYTNSNYMYHYERSADDSQGTEFGVHSTGRRTHLGDGWYHAWGSFTTQSYTVKGYFGCWHYEYNTKNKVSLAAVSLVKGNTVRPPAQFIDEGATLGNTEALLDLTGNTTIDLTNVSFDSNAQITFDGTDDRVAISPRRQFAITDQWTTELVFKPTDGADTSWNGLFGGALGQGGYWMFHSSGNLTYYEGSSAETGTKITYRTWTKANTFTTGNYHHLTIVYTPLSSTQGSFTLYYNGGEKVETFTWTFSWSYSLDMQNIGAGDGRYGTNDVHYFKQYNRALTASEVASNYNAVKSRFNI